MGRSSDSAVPWHSRGYRDDAIQRSFLEASLEFWGDTANNPAGMVDLANSAVWAWDARPYSSGPIAMIALILLRRLMVCCRQQS